MYAVHITPAADRILKKLPEPVRQALTNAAQQLGVIPALLQRSATWSVSGFPQCLSAYSYRAGIRRRV